LVIKKGYLCHRMAYGESGTKNGRIGRGKGEADSKDGGRVPNLIREADLSNKNTEEKQGDKSATDQGVSQNTAGLKEGSRI